MNDDFEVSDGVDVVMRSAQRVLRRPVSDELVDQVLEHVRAGNVQSAWTVVADAVALAESLDCPWCDHLGLHETCWLPRVADSGLSRPDLCQMARVA